MHFFFLKTEIRHDALWVINFYHVFVLMFIHFVLRSTMQADNNRCAVTTATTKSKIHIFTGFPSSFFCQN